MTLVLRWVAVIGLTGALSCGIATAAGARDLLILEADGVRDSGHDLEQLVDDFLLRRGAFSGLTLQPSYSASLDYLGIANAMTMQASAFGSQVVLAIPSIGFTKTFTGTSPNDVENQIEDFFSDDGAHELAKFLEKTNTRTPLAALDGNPRATTALFAANAFDRFGIPPMAPRGGERVAEVGSFDLAVRVGGGGVDVKHFDSLNVSDASLTLAGDFDRVGVSLSLLGQYRNFDGADVYDAGLELGIPIAVARPGGSLPLRWTLTPVVQTGGSGSRDLLAGGFMVGGGAVSSFGWSVGAFELLVGDEILYYRGVPLGEIGGVRIETELDQWITRNGIELAMYPLGEWLSIGGGVKASHFLGTNVAVDSYLTPFAGVAVELLEFVRLRIGWESDFGAHDYEAHVGRVDLGFEF